MGLGVLAWAKSRREADVAVSSPRPASQSAAFRGTALVGTFHPKPIVFFVAFAPQFIAPGTPYAPQAALLVATFAGS